MNKPNQLKKWLWVTIIGTAILIWMPITWVKKQLQGNDTVGVGYVDQSKEIDSLKKIIEVYKEDRIELTQSVDQLNDQISDLKYTIQRRENTIANLKRQTNENVSNVTNFNTTDIYKFLSDRYKDTDTTSISR